MRIPPDYSRHRLDIRGHRLGTIHVALRRGENPRHHVFINLKVLFQMGKPADEHELRRWSQYLKRTYPELSYASPTSS